MSKIKRIQELMGLSEEVIRKKILIREYDDMRDILVRITRTLGSIPTAKVRASDVIKKVLGSDKMFTIGNDVNLNELPHLKDRIRFYDYYLSFVVNLDSRGYDFEGMVSGLFGGEVVPGAKTKEDVIIGGEYYSIKLSQPEPGERYSLGSLRKGFEDAMLIMTKDNRVTSNIQTPYDLMRLGSEYDKYKRQMLVSSFSVNGGTSDNLNWMFAVLTGDFTIPYCVYTSEELIQLLLNPNNVKSGKSSGKMSISVPQNVVFSNSSKVGKIIFPKIERKDLESTLYRTENKRMEDKIADLFGPFKESIRFDLLTYIRENPQRFLERVIDLYGDRLRNMLSDDER